LTIATSVGVPPNFVLAVALEENPTLNVRSCAINKNGTWDVGVMQLNTCWYTGPWFNAEKNITAGCIHIKHLINNPTLNTMWDVAISYNAGTAWARKHRRPPESSINYAMRVMGRWEQLELQDSLSLRAAQIPVVLSRGY